MMGSGDHAFEIGNMKFSDSLAFYDVIGNVLQESWNKSPAWSVQCVRFWASLWEKHESINLITKDQLILHPHINWLVCDENQ